MHAGPRRFCNSRGAGCGRYIRVSASQCRISQARRRSHLYPKSSPEYFALFAREAAALGVRISAVVAEQRQNIRAWLSVKLCVHKNTSAHLVRRRETRARCRADPKVNSENLQARNSPSAWNRSAKGLSLERIYEQSTWSMASKNGCHRINTEPWPSRHGRLIVAAHSSRGVETVPHLTNRQNIIAAS